MTKMIKMVGALVAAAALTPALQAQDSNGEDIKPFEITGSVGLLSQYKDRGINLNEDEIFPTAPVANLNIEHKSGVYVGVAAAFNLDTPLNQETKTEVYGGYAFASGAYVIDLSAALDIYSGGPNEATYEEFRASVSRDFGVAFWRTGVSYSPDGRVTNPFGESFYIDSELEVPFPGFSNLSFQGKVGYDFRSGGLENVADWSAGLSLYWKGFEYSVGFQGSEQDGPFGETDFVASLKFYF